MAKYRDGTVAINRRMLSRLEELNGTIRPWRQLPRRQSGTDKALFNRGLIDEFYRPTIAGRCVLQLICERDRAIQNIQ